MLRKFIGIGMLVIFVLFMSWSIMGDLSFKDAAIAVAIALVAVSFLIIGVALCVS
ncbi:hypothetical protein LCGC14_2581590 [marine sediment metagenome]|uniref:Uncharacterized protein n=1 Tax=marine sediment metagenome TaxID=412755 RepID=A0A0F9D710_9ZZZZ